MECTFRALCPPQVGEDTSTGETGERYAMQSPAVVKGSLFIALFVHLDHHCSSCRSLRPELCKSSWLISEVQADHHLVVQTNIPGTLAVGLYV